MRFSFYYKSLKSTYLKDIDSGGIIEFDGEIISKIDSDSIYFKNENKKTIEEAFLLDERNDCKTMSLVIVTNTNCNLRCSYCYEGNKDNNTQIMESYEAIYNFILANIKYNNIKKLDVEFTGGEPLLNKELIVNLVKTLNENLLLTDINYTLITNGVLLDNDIIQFLSENKFSVQISLDGFKNDHNLERHGENIYNSYDVIINKMKKILTDELNIDLILRINVTNKNKDNLYLLVDDLVKKFSAKQLKSIYLYFSIVDVSFDSENYINYSEYAKIIVGLYTYVMLNGIKLKTFELFGGDCMARNRKSLTILPNGNIVKCYSLVSYKQFYDNRKIEDIRYIEDIDPILAYCPSKDCPIYNNCMGGCGYRSYIESRKFKNSCDYESLLYINKFLFILELISDLGENIKNPADEVNYVEVKKICFE